MKPAAEAAPPDTPEHRDEAQTPVPEEASAPELPSLETVKMWLAQARASDVLALPHKPDFAYIVTMAFAGVRVNASGYAVAHVRSRLAQEVIKNETFAEKLRVLAEAAVPVDGPAPPAPHPRRLPAPDGREQLKAERERAKTLRAERDTARAAVTAAEKAAQQAAHGQQQAETARADAEAAAQEQARKTGRLERRMAQMQQEITELAAERDTLQKAAKAVPPTAPKESKPSRPADANAVSPLADGSIPRAQPAQSGRRLSSGRRSAAPCARRCVRA